MNPEWLQFVYYAGFALLGWWLRHRGILAPPTPVPGGPAPAVPGGHVDPRTLVELLRALLDRMPQGSPVAGVSAPTPTGAGNVFHVPVEVTATPRSS